MGYLDRLMEDSGITTLPARAPDDGGAAPEPLVASPEIVDTVEVGPPAGETDAPPDSSPTERGPGEAHRLAPGAPVSGPPSPVTSPEPVQPVPPDLTSPTQTRPVPASPIGEGPADEVPPSSVDDRSDAAPRAPQTTSPPTEATPAERVLRTLAAVRDWTASTPSPDERLAETPGVGQEATLTADRGRDAPAEVVATPPEPSLRPGPSTRFPAPPPAPASDDADVVNLSVSIGAIELTIDGSQSPEPVPPGEMAGAAPPVPDAAARMRRHFYRQPIGW